MCSPPYQSLPHLDNYKSLSYQFVPVFIGFLPSSVSATTLGTWLYHLFPVGIPCFLSNNQLVCLPTTSCQIRYFDLANTGRPLLGCITVSLDSPHNLRIGDTSWMSIWFFIKFTCSACSCAAHTIVSVSFLSCSPFSNCHVLSVLTFSVSFRNRR